MLEDSREEELLDCIPESVFDNCMKFLEDTIFRSFLEPYMEEDYDHEI